jgi:FkbM family methyltransferase
MKNVFKIMRIVSRMRIFNPILNKLNLNFSSLFIKLMKANGNVDYENNFFIVTKINGCKMSLDLYKPTQRSIYCAYKYERKITNLVSKILNNEDVFIDVGAHVGYYSLLAAKKMGANGIVIAFEPNVDNYKILEHNVNLNEFSQIKLYKIGLSDYDGEAQFYINPFNDGGSSLTKFDYKALKIVKINVEKLDTFLNDIPLNKIDLIKIDVEGHQMNTLRGMEHTLQKFHPKIIVEFNDSVSKTEIINYLSTLNYSECINLDEYNLFCL